MTWPLSALMRRAERAARQRPNDGGGDSGVTLVEVMVSMSLTAIITGLFTAGVVQSYQMTNATDRVADAQTNLQIAFSRLDSLVRYASFISQPGQGATAQYVEFATTRNGSAFCTQLRLDPTAQTLQSRTWAVGAPSSVWATLASDVVQPAEFTTTPATVDGQSRDQLTVTLTVRAAGGPNAAATTSSVTFTAMNTAFDTETPGDTRTEMGRP